MFETLQKQIFSAYNLLDAMIHNREMQLMIYF